MRVRISLDVSDLAHEGRFLAVGLGQGREVQTAGSYDRAAITIDAGTSFHGRLGLFIHTQPRAAGDDPGYLDGVGTSAWAWVPLQIEVVPDESALGPTVQTVPPRQQHAGGN